MVRTLQYALLVAIIAATFSACADAQQSPKRLILKDGSFQTVTKWEVAGNRVRYYSAERFVWEELPNELIDWPATEKYNKEREAERAAKVVPGSVDDAEDPETPIVAPGLHLPDGGGVFLLDNFQQQPQLLELMQNGGELNRHMRKNILRAVIDPLALSSKQTIELKGEHAKVQSHLAQPAIFVDVDPAPAAGQPSTQTVSTKDKAPQHFGIVRMETNKKNVRVVGNLNVAVYGKVSQKENWIKTTTTQVGDWVKVVPDDPLPPGEYAVVELLEKGQVNLFVWDFGVDPSAPANPNAWTARRPAQTGPDQGPVLEKRPK
jgi:hypothetical protein